MKITDIRCECYKWPKPQVFASGRGRGSTKYTHTFLNFVFIETDEGITGIGIGRNKPEIDLFRDLLLGQDPLCHELMWQKMYHGVIRGYRYLETISSIDIALWDLKAKVAGMPLYKLLGGVRSKLDCYIAGGYYTEDKSYATLQKEMETYLKMGAKAVKIKVGALTPIEDAKRVKLVREVIGQECKLLLDANGAWKFNEAIEFSQRVGEYFPFWLEEPCMFSDLDGFRQLHASTSIPLAAGESIYGKYEHRDLIDSGTVSFVQPDATMCGGVTEVLKIGAYADTKNIWIAPHGVQQIHVHLNCSMPNASIVEFYPPEFDKLVYAAWRNPVQINSDGTVSPAETPGASLEYNAKVLEPWRVE